LPLFSLSISLFPGESETEQRGFILQLVLFFVSIVKLGWVCWMLQQNSGSGRGAENKCKLCSTKFNAVVRKVPTSLFFPFSIINQNNFNF
jgi:hypothetical protein